MYKSIPNDKELKKEWDRVLKLKSKLEKEVEKNKKLKANLLQEREMLLKKLNKKGWLMWAEGIIVQMCLNS